MQKNCHPIGREEIMAYLDGELAAGQAAAAAHLEGCQECLRLAADLRGVSQRMMTWQVASATSGVIPRIAAALDDRERVREKASTLGRRTWRDILGMRRLSPYVISFASIGLVVVLVLMTRLSWYREASHPMDIGSLSRVAAPTQAPMRSGRSQISVDKGVPDFSNRASVGGVEQKIGDSVDTNGPMIVRTAQVTLTTTEFDKDRAGIEEILKRHRGYVGGLSVSNASGTGRTLNATLRVPADQLESTMAELKKLGRVASESQTGEEVTQQYVDLEARLSNARNTEKRLIDLLRQSTGKLADVLSVELEIGRVRGEIERMEAERKSLANRVDFATLNVVLTEDYRAQLQMMPPSTTTRFRNAAVEGFSTMVEGIVSVVLFLISYGPSLLLWGGLLFFPVRGVWRRLRRDPAR